MSRSARDAATAFIAQAFAVVSAIGTQSALAWLLGSSDRGSFAICVTLSAVLGVLFVPGTDRAAQMLSVTGRMQTSEAVTGALFFSFLACIVGIATGLVGLWLGLDIFEQASAAQILFALCVLLPVTLCSVTLELQLAAQRQYRRIAGIVGLQTLVNLAGVLVLVWWLELGVLAALTAYAASQVVTCAIYWRVLRRDFGVRLVRIGRGAARELFNYGLRYYGARIGHQLDVNLGLLVLGMIATRADLGIFAATSALMLRLLMLATAIDTVMLPNLAEAADRRAEQVARACRISALLTALVCVPVLVGAQWLVALLFSPEFLRGTSVIWWLAPGVLMLGGANPLMGYFRVVDRPETCSMAVWCGLIAGALLTPILYNRFGLAGAACAMSVSLALRSIVLMASFSRATNSLFGSILFPRLHDVRDFAAMLRGALRARAA